MSSPAAPAQPPTTPTPPSQSPQATLVARSAPMRRLLALAERAAASEATVLIAGESGTGKERLARYLHDHSQRAAGPFIAINCGALPENLLESELFGHTRGAFTGANAVRQGLFAAAAGGTIFLDEIGETPLAMQVRLLRALQERKIRVVGANHEVDIDVRIIAATNRDLSEMVAAKTFREDLYFRLRVVPLEIPPLRQRRDDILQLARTFIGASCSANRCGPCALSAEVLDALQRYPWPGNVRELENAIERAVVLADGQPRIELGDLPPEIRAATAAPLGAPSATSPSLASTPPGTPPPPPPPPAAHRVAASATAAPPFVPRPLAEVEREHILATLQHFHGHRRKTAAALQIGENTLWRRLKKWGV